MNLTALLRRRAEAGRPVRAALIGAGKFGSMFLAQVPTIPGLEVAAIADLDPERARAACRTVGWDEARIGGDPLRRRTAAAPARRTMSRWSSRRPARRPPASPMPSRRSRRASTSSWSTWRPTCWSVPFSPAGRGRRASSIPWPTATSRPSSPRWSTGRAPPASPSRPPARAPNTCPPTTGSRPTTSGAITASRPRRRRRPA